MPLLGSERISLEGWDHGIDQLFHARDRESALWFAGVVYPGVNGATSEECLNLIKDRSVVIPQGNDELRDAGHALRRSSPAQDEASFSIAESRQPISESIAICPGRERRDRIGRSHDGFPFFGRKEIALSRAWSVLLTPSRL
jgi:hypothetical protein